MDNQAVIKVRQDKKTGTMLERTQLKGGDGKKTGKREMLRKMRPQKEIQRRHDNGSGEESSDQKGVRFYELTSAH